MQATLAIAALLCVPAFALFPTKTAHSALRFVSEAKARVGNHAGLKRNPEIDMNTTQLITSKGYPVETHHVVTEDGYILGTFRMPHGRHNKHVQGPKPVVLLMHGLFGSGDTWLMNPVSESLAFILADAGADVWIGNCRGNHYARNHTKLSPDDLDFWKFSWDEMAAIDLPATIYYVLNQTGAEQLYYVGHSQGTAIGFARFGEDQKLASKVKHFIALAPIGRVKNTISPVRYLVPFADQIEFFMDIFGHGELNIPTNIQKLMAGTLCEDWGDIICENMLFLLCGFNAKSMNASRTDIYLSHFPAGTSSRVLIQWAQNVAAGEFQHFDFGEKENLIKYGQKTPPIYRPEDLKIPVAIYRGGQDWLADPRDVEWLLPQLKHITQDINVPFYEHIDMVAAIDVNVRMYKDLVKIIMSNDSS